MPLALWLIPYEDNPFNKTAQELISDTVPRNFLSPHEINNFIPHVTLTSDIDPDKKLGGKPPQAWLDSLQFPAFKREFDEVILEMDSVEAEDPFYRKMNLAIKENANLTKLATWARKEGVADSEDEAKKWAESEYRPHLSLLYGDIPTQDVKNKIPLIEMKIGFAIGDLFACCGGTLCMGGWIVVVDTGKPIDQWKPIAKREADWVMWRASKNLI